MLTFIGEQPGGNPHTFDPHKHRPLFPYPAGCSGHRLCNILGLTRGQYLGLRRLNLIPVPTKRWPAEEAREAALKLCTALEGDQVFLLGRKVAAAFGLEDRAAFSEVLVGRTTFFLLPHPSGLNRAWSDELAVPRTRALFRRAVNLSDEKGLRRLVS